MTRSFPEITFGFEYEVNDNGLAVLDELHDMGAVAHPYLHPYHCRCDEACDHYDGHYLFSAQQDETVSAEFPSKVLTWGTERAERAFRTMERAAVLAGADLSGDSGMHVHVAKPVDDEYPTIWRLLRLFIRYQEDIRELAEGTRSEVRDYNSPIAVREEYAEAFWSDDDTFVPGQPWYMVVRATGRAGRWLNPDQDETVEFRLWNAVKAAWRMRLACGMSVAMMRAAEDGVMVDRNDRRTLEEVLAPYLDAGTWAGLIRQRFHKGGAEFGIAQPRTQLTLEVV